ncbi:MAG: hypothetical protein U5N27_05750 [Rhizobium sp.]|nr:hypothetical protein [Rhizobium sp.]
MPRSGVRRAGLLPDGGLIDLDVASGFNPRRRPSSRLWRGELAFVHAVSAPSRDGRSRFDGQDMLGRRLRARGEGG